MTSSRIRQLAAALKQRFLAVQKSEQIHSKLKGWEKNILELNLKEIENVSLWIAERVDRQYRERLRQGISENHGLVVQSIIAAELANLSS